MAGLAALEASIVLSRATRGDQPDLIAANRESREHHLPWESPFTDPAGFEQWYQRGLLGPHINLIARKHASGEIVGVIDLQDIAAGPLWRCRIGYFGMAPFAGRGLMSAAVGLAVRFAFDEVGLHRIEADIRPENLRSLALIRRLGFQREGLSRRLVQVDGAWRDHELWSLLKGEGCSVVQAAAG